MGRYNGECIFAEISILLTKISKVKYILKFILKLRDLSHIPNIYLLQVMVAPVITFVHCLFFFFVMSLPLRRSFGRCIYFRVIVQSISHVDLTKNRFILVL